MTRRTLSLLSFAALAATAFPACADATLDEEVRLLTRLLALEPGSRVADIGAGDGDYAVAIAGVVGDEGVVYATEIEQEKQDAIRAAAEAAGANAVQVVQAVADGTGLEPASCDAAFLRDVYHHLTDPERFLAGLIATVRPGGRVVLIDFPPTWWLSLWTPEGTPDRGGHGIERDALVAEAEAAGFVAVETIAEWPSSNFITRTYAVAFERPASDGDRAIQPADSPRPGSAD